jgi:hypothetical protein
MNAFGAACLMQALQDKRYVLKNLYSQQTQAGLNVGDGRDVIYGEEHD